MASEGERPFTHTAKLGIIELLQITAAEERQLSFLISDTEKRRRELERRRASGVIPRDRWLAANTASRERPWTVDGVSRSTWYRRKQNRC